ncbi:MAG: hypothetical protein AVDCRST_MAG86-1352 [uncultured Truepera sp.]|uniref:Uncharacterized protein n=1 Tax=uncultured Truepera sp. TaxID=543023 RepID=A0A6J4V9A8_9DEIN|nr:MAG: hypothetical protein AVDCRST_MAG86-1352 [uncultured Truepera sp.]
MKRGSSLLLTCSLLGGIWASAQEEPLTEPRTFSEEQLGAAFDTCRALAEEAAETRLKFPMKYGLTDEPFSEQLERCVLSVLQGDVVEPMPLG